MNDDKRFILAIALSAAILLGFQSLHLAKQPSTPAPVESAQQPSQPVSAVGVPPAGHADATLPIAAQLQLPREDIIKQTPRVAIASSELEGSINLKGAILDDLKLVNYREGLTPQSPEIILLSPSGSAAPQTSYFADLGWLAEGTTTVVPNKDTVWKAEGASLSPDHPVKLTWDNGAGLLFERSIALDDHYMFTITDSVQNKSSSPVALYPYALIARQGDPTAIHGKSSVIHEGPLGVIDGTLEEHPYAKLAKDKTDSGKGKGGWLGIADKYWLTAFVPPQTDNITADFIASGPEKYDPAATHFQADYRGTLNTIAPNTTLERTTLFFAGAKTVSLLDGYASRYDIPHFDRAIDFGWFYFLTKPFLYLLGYLGKTLGSLGVAILVFTVMLKLVTLPLSLKSYHSMAKMKALQPEIAKLQEKYKDDKAKQGQEMMAFYAREKVNPMAGCLPQLIQIPIFFALYKVLYVSLEMRHAPFYGWIKDMSSPDPTSIVTLFGLMPWTPPAFLPHLGLWPILMGLSMFMQQRLSPQPADKSQAQMMMFMPILFTFMLAQMPAGLVIYWTWSNLIGIAQQYYIMRKDLAKKSRA